MLTPEERAEMRAEHDAKYAELAAMVSESLGRGYLPNQVRRVLGADMGRLGSLYADDEHLNNVALGRWDVVASAMMREIPFSGFTDDGTNWRKYTKDRPHGLTLSECVCLLKWQAGQMAD